MVSLYTLRFQCLLRALVFPLLFTFSFFCPDLWASQEAIVTVDKAFIYADLEMTSPIGFVQRGKKLTVGEIPRNKAQVYPIVVSGKIAYIKVLDVSTEKESVESTRLTAERFARSMEKPVLHTRASVDFVKFVSKISTKKETLKFVDGDDVNWNGISVRGDVLFNTRLDAEVIVNYLNTIKGEEELNILEIGIGGGLRIIDSKRFIFKVHGQALAIPFSSYNIDDDRLTGYGYSVGGGGNIGIIMGEHWGIDLFGAVYYTKVMDFQIPGEREEFNPSFAGVRLGAGLTLRF